MSEQTPRNSGKCAICGKPKDPKYRPFCSKRCADVDLHRWFSGGYVIGDADQSEANSQDSDEG